MDFAWYINFVQTYPYLSAMVQFAVLGTLGDCIAKCLTAKSLRWPFSLKETFWKPVEWAILAVFIKFAFIGFNGFVDALAHKGLLPDSVNVVGSFMRAVSISVSMNLQFGFLLVILHRILDYLPFGKANYNNINKGFYSLIWFWIPAHTLTFMQPPDYQIGLAAVWSLALGLILGLFNKK